MRNPDLSWLRISYAQAPCFRFPPDHSDQEYAPAASRHETGEWNFLNFATERSSLGIIV
jgi:hypothetical protein